MARCARLQAPPSVTSWTAGSSDVDITTSQYDGYFPNIDVIVMNDVDVDDDVEVFAIALLLMLSLELSANQWNMYEV